jgi:hypothetical protein
MSYLDTRVGVYLYGKNKKTGKDYYQLSEKRSVPLGELLKSGESRHLIRQYRRTRKYDIKKQIASYTPAGFYPEKRTKTTTPQQQTGLVQIDIDGKSNPREDWVLYRDYLFREYPFIAVAAISCGGEGIYLLINTTGFENYDGHYFAAVKLFSEREELVIDTAVSSSNEVRFLSLPEDCLIREDADVFTEVTVKPKNEYENATQEGDGALIEVPKAQRGKMQRENVVRFITANIHNGVPINEVKVYLTQHCEDYMSRDSHMYGNAEGYCDLADDLYNRYADQFNQAIEKGRKATLTRAAGGGSSKAAIVHPATQEREKAMRDSEKLRTAIDWVQSRCVYDVIGDQYVTTEGTTNPDKEYAAYNKLSDDMTFIERHFFVTAFATGDIERVNSIKRWGQSLPEWDKKDHIRKLAGYMPAEDPAQAELFLKGWLIRTFIQAVNPEDRDETSIVNRWFLILHQHKEESGKSSFLQWLAPRLEWVKLSGLEENKDGYSAMAKYMLVLDEELAGLGSFRYNERLKAMVSTSKVDVRPPYMKADISMPRVASFCGSTNNDKIFSPTESNTRFLVIPLKDFDFEWKQYVKNVDRAQLWAQVKHLATTDWLDSNDAAIKNYRNEINQTLLKDSEERYVVETYLERTDDGTIMQTEQIAEQLRETFNYTKINLITLGQSLRKLYGERVNGYVNGGRRKGYPVRFKKGESGSESIARLSPREDDFGPRSVLTRAGLAKRKARLSH